MTMNDEGRVVLAKSLDDAIEATGHPSTDPNVCESHEGIRTGINVLLLCKREEMESARASERKEHGGANGNGLGTIQIGKWKAAGVPAIILALFLGAMLLQYHLTSKAVDEAKEAASHNNSLLSKQTREIVRQVVQETLKGELR
jgi:hypothetical protein